MNLAPRPSRQMRTLCTFQPVQGENVFRSSPVGSAQGSILILRGEDTLCFLGTVSLTVLLGRVEVLGTELTSSSKPYHVFAPRSTPVPILQLSRPDGPEMHGQREEDPIAQLPRQVLNKVRMGDAVIRLDSLVGTGIRGLSQVVGAFDGAFGSSVRTEGTDLGVKGFHPVGYRLLGVPFSDPASLHRYLSPSIISSPSFSHTNGVRPLIPPLPTVSPRKVDQARQIRNRSSPWSRVPNAREKARLRGHF